MYLMRIKIHSIIMFCAIVVLAGGASAQTQSECRSGCNGYYNPIINGLMLGKSLCETSAANAYWLCTISAEQNYYNCVQNPFDVAVLWLGLRFPVF